MGIEKVRKEEWDECESGFVFWCLVNSEGVKVKYIVSRFRVV